MLAFITRKYLIFCFSVFRIAFYCETGNKQGIWQLGILDFCISIDISSFYKMGILKKLDWLWILSPCEKNVQRWYFSCRVLVHVKLIKTYRINKCNVCAQSRYVPLLNLQQMTYVIVCVNVYVCSILVYKAPTKKNGSTVIDLLISYWSGAPLSMIHWSNQSQPSANNT